MLISGRTNTILLVLILAVGVGIAAMLASGVRGGPLDPPAPPSATGTLPQVEPRSPIPPVGWNGAFPIVIDQPGSYFLTRDIVGAVLAPSWNGIEITAPRVSLDLNGFSVIADGTGRNGVGVVGSLSGIKVSNGTVAGWGESGIDLVQASNSEVTGVIVAYNGTTSFWDGIKVGSGSKVTHCVASHNGRDGIIVFGSGSQVSDCIADGNGVAGIAAGGGSDNTTIIRNTVTNSGIGFYVGSVQHVTLTQNIARGNSGGNYQGVGSCIACDIGPIGTAATSTSPWANISD